MKLSLTGQWEFRSTDWAQYREATVPGCQFLDLMRIGSIEDPFVGTNEQKVQWVHDQDFEYRRVFRMDAASLSADRIRLVCTQLDTICTLSLNGQRVGYADNCHRTFSFDVKPYLREGDNVLLLLFSSPRRYVEEKRRACPTPVNSNGLNGIVHIRKPQCHFGWDWGPVLTPVGVSGDIYLDISSGEPLGALDVRTQKVDDTFVLTASATGAHRITLTHPDGRVEVASGASARFVISDPQLWWTRELSDRDEQPLYTVRAEQLPDGVVEESHCVRMGLRTIELDRGRDQYGYNFRFILNGVPLFIKGANYIPPDSFITRFDAARLEALLDAVQFSHINMLRIWGGGYYADDRLLDACDRRGILVWQDAMFACQAYPFFDEAFLANVLAEIADNARRLRSHPSLALWCGNNEIEAMHLAWATMHRYVEWTERFFYHILPEALSQVDDGTPYIPGSPTGTAHNRDVDADFAGDTHLWGVWHGLQPLTHYRKRMTRFCSEFGFESLPSFSTVRAYAEPQDYPLDSAVQRAHQKCAGGNDKMLYYIAGRFPLGEDIEDLIYLSQITQQACVADATEHWRRHRGRSNGAMYWQLNDCWPTCSWSSIDYYGAYKALQYTARHFNAPVSLSLEDSKGKVSVFVLNDLTQDQTLELTCQRFDFDKTSPPFVRQTVTVGALSATKVYEIDTVGVDPRRTGFAVRLYRDGVCISRRTCLLLPEKKLRLPRAPVSISQEMVDGVCRISLTSPVYQRFVYLESDAPTPFSDNFFDLLPSETITVTQAAASPSPVRVRSLADVRPASPLKVLRARVKVFFSARNIANALYHSRVPKEDSGQ